MRLCFWLSCNTFFKILIGFLWITIQQVPGPEWSFVKVQIRILGTWWRSYLRHCATSRKIGGSIPDGVIFHWPNPPGRNMAPGLKHRGREMSTSCLLGSKGGRWQPWHPHVSIVLKFREPLTSWSRNGLFRPVQGPHYLSQIRIRRPMLSLYVAEADKTRPPVSVSLSVGRTKKWLCYSVLYEQLTLRWLNNWIIFKVRLSYINRTVHLLYVRSSQGRTRGDIRYIVQTCCHYQATSQMRQASQWERENAKGLNAISPKSFSFKKFKLLLLRVRNI